MGEGKVGICGDGTIERLDRAGVHGQLRLTGLYVGVPRGERRRGQGESVSVRQHDGLIRYSTRNDTISLDARERGLLARKGLVCDLADWGWPLLPTRLPRCAQPGSRKKDLAKDQPGHRAVDQKIVPLPRHASTYRNRPNTALGMLSRHGGQFFRSGPGGSGSPVTNRRSEPVSVLPAAPCRCRVALPPRFCMGTLTFRDHPVSKIPSA